MGKMMRIASVGRECVACGCCVKVCPRDAIHVPDGVAARVDRDRCVGCGKCAKICPAAVIEVVEQGVSL